MIILCWTSSYAFTLQTCRSVFDWIRTGPTHPLLFVATQTRGFPEQKSSQHSLWTYRFDVLLEEVPRVVLCHQMSKNRLTCCLGDKTMTPTTCKSHFLSSHSSGNWQVLWKLPLLNNWNNWGSWMTISANTRCGSYRAANGEMAGKKLTHFCLHVYNEKNNPREAKQPSKVLDENGQHDGKQDASLS